MTEEEANETELPRLGLREPLTDVVDTEDSLARACAELAISDGPIALDAERASGYRYSQRAYLIQVRREGAGTFLIDPTAYDGLEELDDALGDAEWILHAATQDLPCLRETGLHPASIFDTELAGRLLNLPRVGLASLVEHYLGLSMAKEHSAADWSTRPLPEPWLLYAALDVEVLVELRNAVAKDLAAAGKSEWARQEFDALLDFTGPAPRVDPWRRTSGIHKVRDRRALALIRELWFARDRIAQNADVTPGRILRDQGLVELATNPPRNRNELKSHPAMKSGRARRYFDDWIAAIESAQSLPDTVLPGPAPRYDGPPPPRVWAEKSPEAAVRLGRARESLAAVATEFDLPVENLLTPSIVRSVAWEPPTAATVESIRKILAERGARPWQIDLTAPVLQEAFDAN